MELIIKLGFLIKRKNGSGVIPLPDYVRILKNETSCLYKGYDFDCTVEEYGGPEGFLKTFDDENN